MANVNEIPVKSYLNLELDPVNTNHAATKGYVDTQIGSLDASKAAAEHTHVAASVTDLGTAAKKGFTTSVTSGSADLVTSGGVYSYIAGLNLGTTYAAKTHTHTLGQIIYSGTTGYAAGTTISSESTDGQLATAKAVYSYISGLDLGNTYAPKTHNHNASDINAGTLGAARLPAATTSAKGGVIVGAGLSVSSGTISVDYATCKTGLGLGTAAYCATGTASGNIPVLDNAGKLPVSVMPSRVIGGEYLGEVSNQAGMLAKSNATVGDFVKRTDKGTYWMLGVDADNAYATADNWFEYAGAVTSVNGSVGVVTISAASLGLETTLSTSNDAKFPSSKAVATYVSGQISGLNLANTYAAKTHTHTSSQISDAISAFTDGANGKGKVVKTLGSGPNAGYISADLIPIDGISITLDAAGQLQVDPNSLSEAVASYGYLTQSSARSLYLNRSATGVSEWGAGASYAVGDVVFYRGKLYRCKTATSASTFVYEGAFAAWEEITIYDLIPADRYAGTITGNGSATDFTVTHNLGVKDVEVTLIEDSTNQQVLVAVTMLSATQVKIGFGAAPANNKVYRVIVRK